MKWTIQHDVEFCKEVVVSKLFETKKRSAERAKVWEDIAQKLEKNEAPKIQGGATVCHRQVNKTYEAISEEGK